MLTSRCGSDCSDVTSVKFCVELVVASIKDKFLVNRHLLMNTNPVHSTYVPLIPEKSATINDVHNMSVAVM